MKAFAYEGSVSWGTMRPEDLIPRFLDVLEDLLEAAGCHEHDAEIRSIRSRMNLRGWARSDAGQDAFGWLFDALEEMAPEGYYFGANEGDGADYGFWPVAEDEE